jgi:MFS family permease
VFGALWAVHFLQVKLSCSLRESTLINALFFLGTGISCPMFGLLMNYFKYRNRLIISGNFLTTLLLLLILYLPTQNMILIASFMLFLGISCGAYILAYPIANELAPSHSLSTCTGFTNTLALVTTPLFQPLIGFLLDVFSSDGVYTISTFQNALLIIPIALLISIALVCFLPEKKSPSFENHLTTQARTNA